MYTYGTGTYLKGSGIVYFFFIEGNRQLKTVGMRVWGGVVK